MSLSTKSPNGATVTETFDGKRNPGAPDDGRADAQAQLEAAELRFRRLIDATPSILWTAAADGRITWVSERWFEYTGRPTGAIDRDWLAHMHPDDRTPVTSAWHAALATGKPFQFERRTRGKDGAYRWFLTQASPEHDPSGTVIGWVGSTTDIDDLKRGETHRRRLEQLIRQSSELVALSDADGALTYINEAGRRLIGVPIDGDLTGLKLIDFLTPDSRASFSSAVMPSLCARGHWEGEMQIRHAGSGEVRDVQRTVSCLRGDGDQLVGFASVMRDITAAKRAESDLRDSEARYRAAVQAGRMGSWETDLVGGVRSWSPEGMALFGLDLPDGRDVLGGPDDRWFAALHPEDRDNAASLYRLAGSQDSFPAEYRIVRPDGATLWLSGRGHVVARGTDGRPLRLVSVMADVTDREVALAALRESEDRFRSMATMAHEGIWTVDRGGRTSFVNQRMAELLGLPIDDIVGRPVPEFCFPQDVADVHARMANSFAGIAEQFECRFRRADGTSLYVLAATSPLRGRGGAIVGAMGSFLDLTDRRRAEEAEREVQARLRHAADAAGLTHLVVDHEHGSLWAAANHETVLGFAIAADVVQVDLASGLERLLARVAPADQPRLRRMLSHGAAESGESRIEYRLRGDDGRERWIESIATVETNRAESPARIFSTHLDVTQRKAAEDHVKLLMNEVNHRAKNLLTVVLSIARQTARDTRPDEFARYLSERLQGLSASQDLIIQGNWQGVSMAALAQSQLQHLGAELRARLSLSGDEITLSPPAAQGLGMALHELATNALKYGALASREGRIDVRWSLSGPAGQQRFEISWTERGGPPVVPPTRRGFGRTVIERMAALAVNGQVALSYAPEGVSWHLEAPAAAVCATPMAMMSVG